MWNEFTEEIEDDRDFRFGGYDEDNNNKLNDSYDDDNLRQRWYNYLYKQDHPNYEQEQEDDGNKIKVKGQHMSHMGGSWVERHLSGANYRRELREELDQVTKDFVKKTGYGGTLVFNKISNSKDQIKVIFFFFL